MSEETSSATADAGPGDKVAGYRLEEKIGQGGMAVVYRAYDERLERRVALKLLAPGMTADTAFRARFIRATRAVTCSSPCATFRAGTSSRSSPVAARSTPRGSGTSSPRSARRLTQRTP